MAKGAKAKQEVFKKILEVFPDSFLYNDGKEVRINTIEDGNEVQIKVTLTAAKVAVEGGKGAIAANGDDAPAELPWEEKVPEAPSAEEQERLKKLLDKLNV